MKSWLSTRGALTFFLILWAILFAGSVLVDAFLLLIFNARHLELERDGTSALVWAGALSAIRYVITRAAAQANREEDN